MVASPVLAVAGVGALVLGILPPLPVQGMTVAEPSLVVAVQRVEWYTPVEVLAVLEVLGVVASSLDSAFEAL